MVSPRGAKGQQLDMELTKEQMLAALFARRMQYNAQENGCSIQQAILDDLEPYDEGEDTQDFWEFYKFGEQVLQAHVYALSDTWFHWDVPETDEWALKAGMPSYCTSYCRLPCGVVEGRQVWQFVFFAPICFDGMEKRRWEIIRHLRLITGHLFGLQLSGIDGNILTVDSLDGKIYILQITAANQISPVLPGFSASRYVMAEEMVRLELEMGINFEVIEVDIDDGE